LQSRRWLATLQTAWGVERSRDDCPWVFIGKGKPSPDRILKKTGRVSHFCTTESESRLSRVTPLIRVTLYIYVLVIKPHCNDMYTALNERFAVLSQLLSQGWNLAGFHNELTVTRLSDPYAGSRHFHLWQSPLVDVFYVSEALATRHTLQPCIEGISRYFEPLFKE
jgi:hypothetical protein